MFNRYLAYNLRHLLSEVDSDTKLLLHPKQTELLEALINEKAIFRNQLDHIQESALEVYRLVLAPSVINTLSIIGGSNTLNVLYQSANVTKSARIRFLLMNQMDNILSNYPTRQCEKESDNVELILSSENHNTISIKTKNSKLNLLNYKIISRAIPTIIIEIPILLYSASDFFAMGITTLSLFAPSMLFMMIYSLYKFHSHGIIPVDIYSLSSIEEYLSVDSKIHTFYTKALILSSLIENVDLTKMQQLNPLELNNLHKLLIPPKLHKSQIAALYQTPLPEIGAIPAILRGLVFLGNKSSVKVIEKFYKTTENEEYKRVALECLDALNTRLTEKPEQLLRASSLPGDALLRASQPSITTDELLKPMVAEVAIVFPQTEEIDELEVNRQQL